MGTTTLQSTAAPKPQPATPSRSMAQVSPDHPAPMAMTVAELAAAIAALPGKRDALREAFDRLAACSPSPLPFAWEDLDGHISSLQSSIALRFRQLRALEAAGAAPAAAALGGTRGDGKGEYQEELEEEEEEEEEEKEEVEVGVEEAAAGELEKKADEEIQGAYSDKICSDEKDGKEAREVELEEEVAELEKADEEMHEANSNKICNDELDEKETRQVEVEEVVAELEKKTDEEMQEANYDKICNDEKDGKEAREDVVEEEEVQEAANVKIDNKIKDEKESREEEQASKVNEQDPDKEMQVVDKDELNSKNASKASQDKEEDQDTNMDETVTMMTSSVQHEEEACYKKQEKEAQEQDVIHEKVEVAKNASDQEAVIANEVSLDHGNRALPCRSDGCNVACANMDAQRLLKLICTNTEFNSEFHAAVRRAPDAAALALHVVELFLHNKIFVKTRKVWESCVGLVQMVPVVVTKPSADTIEQAKRVAKDWKEMIDNPESCNGLGSLASWGLLNFLISYNIVTEFDTKEIFCLFGNIPCKQKKKSVMLLKGLGLGNRIPELMDHLIRNGQQMDVFWLARVLNMVDKYPPLPLLKGYIEKAKQTAMGIPQKNMTHKFQIIKELDNLRRARALTNKKGIINSNLCTSVREEINILIGELEKQKRNLENPLTASTSNSQQQQTKSKNKLKIEQKQEHQKGQENKMRGQLSELAQKLEKEQRKPRQEQQQRQEDKPEEKKQKREDEPEEKKQKQEDEPEEKKQKQEDKPEEKKRKQNKQKHQKRLRQRTHQPPTQGYPAMWNAALRGDLECPPYAAMHGVHHGYPAQPGWPGVQCASPFMPQLGAPEHIGPFTPLYPRPQFYPW